MSETIERARDGIEHAEHKPGSHTDSTARRIAMLIAVLAVALALAEMGEKGEQNSYLTHHIGLSDDWVGFLRSRGTFDATARPSVRASDDNVAAYIAALRQQSCAARTIGSRLWKLQMALRVLEPGVEISWIHLPAWSAAFYRGGAVSRDHPNRTRWRHGRTSIATSGGLEWSLAISWKVLRIAPALRKARSR